MFLDYLIVLYLCDPTSVSFSFLPVQGFLPLQSPHPLAPSPHSNNQSL